MCVRCRLVHLLLSQKMKECSRFFFPECTKCGGVLNIERTWTEYTYYYTTIWVYVVCENGDYSSNEVMSQIPNQTTRKKNDNENESVTQID